MKKRIDPALAVCIGIAAITAVFYLFFVNLSTDTIILFLAQKIYLGKWLAKGVVPFFNPHIFAGIPFLFDPGMGHIHPLNLFFLLPYPLSFAFWSGATSLLFLTGFYLFFRKAGSGTAVSLLFGLMLFFSGSGFIRLNNPTIYAVVAHYGLFLYSLSFLHNKKKGYLFPLITGVLMTLSGHLQFVVYGYLLGVAISILLFRMPLKKIISFFVLLGMAVSWYFILSLPLALTSTRLGAGNDYAAIGPIAPMQLLQLVLPFFLGYVRNGSSWNAGPTAVLLFSLAGSLLFVGSAVKGKIGKSYIVLLSVFFVLSLGLISIPFFRGAGQIWIMVHILSLTALAGNADSIFNLFQNDRRKWYLIIFALSIAAFAFFVSPVFPLIFINGYSFLKHGAASPFFDRDTVSAMGNLFGLSFLLAGVFGLTMYTGTRFRKYSVLFLFFYIVFEGLLVNYHHGYFIPSSVLTNRVSLPAGLNTGEYRVQSTMDVIPYSGFHTYMGSLLFRPPFSKEKPIIDGQEEKTYAKLRNTFEFIPTSWSMAEGIYGIQGYNTFVPKRIAHYFTPVSDDYKTEYAYIISRNEQFTDTSKISHINALDTSRVTMNDLRWEKLGVRYFISDRPLKKYSLIARDGYRYFYENTATLSIYRVEDGLSVKAIGPSYQDPNKMIFDIKKQDAGKKMEMVMNPDGFTAKLNGKQLTPVKRDFSFSVYLENPGTLEIVYSPFTHLAEIIR